MSKQCTAALNCYLAKALPVKYQNTPQQAVHGIYIARRRFVTLLSKKMEMLNKIVMLPEKSLSWSSTIYEAIFFYDYTATLAVVCTQAESEYSQTCIYSHQS